MSEQFENMVEKLRRVAAVIARDKPRLRFFGLVQSESMADRWELVVSSDGLIPWQLESIRYVDQQLNKTLKRSEKIYITMIAVLPPTHELIGEFTRGHQMHHTPSLNGLGQNGDSNHVIDLTPAKDSFAPARA